MSDCFLSYDTSDREIALAVRQLLVDNDVDVFMAPASIPSGDDFRLNILQALRTCRFVVLMASEASCRSTFVQQEIGGAAYGQKHIIPIVWNMPPKHLPGFANPKQAVDLREMSGDQMYTAVNDLARRLRRRLTRDLVIGLGFIGVLLWLARSSDKEGSDRR